MGAARALLVGALAQRREAGARARCGGSSWPAGGNGIRIETALVDWAQPDALLSRAPYDLALAADVLYERSSVAPLLSLLPRLAPGAWVADPGRPATAAFLDEARRRGWRIETTTRDVVQIHRIQLG